MKKTTKRHPLRQILGGLLLGGLVCSGSALQAQTSVKWQQANGATNNAEYFRDVVVDGQGNVYAVGSFQGTANFTFPGPFNYPLTSAGGYDIVIAKYNRAGTLLWVERGGGAGNDYGNSIAIHTDANGNVDNVFTTGTHAAGAGNFTGSADLITGAVPAGAGGEDIYTSVHSATGVFVSVRLDGGPGNERGQGVAVQQTTAASYNVIGGGYIENGAVFSPHAAIAAALRDGYVCRYVYSAGTLTVPSPPLIYSTAGNDQVTNVGIHINGDVYATGAYEGLMSLGGFSVPVSLANSGLADAFVSRMDANATVILNGNRLSSAGQDYALSLAFDRNGNTYVCGYYSGTATTLNALTLPNVLFASRDFWVGKLAVTATGLDFIALEKGGTMNDDRAYDIIADNCGDRIFVAGMVGTGYSNMTYTTSGAAVVLPTLAVTKLNGMLLQLDRNLANPVAYQTYGATTVAGVTSSLHEALYGIGINNVGDINVVGVTSGTNNPAVGGSNVVFSNSAGTTLLTTPTIWANNATADLNYNFYSASIDMSQWPVSATLPGAACGATGNGIAMRDCFVYEGGDYKDAVGTLSISSTVFGTASQDAYLVKYDLYGNALAGTRVTISHPTFGTVRVGDICTALSPILPDVYECGTASSDAATGMLTIAGFTSTLIAAATGPHLFLASYSDIPGVPFVPNWRVFDESGSSTAVDVYADPNGDIYMTGTYSSALSLVHNGATMVIPAPAFATGYLMKINSAGTILWFNGALAATAVTPGGISCILGTSPIVVGSIYNGTDNDVFVHSYTSAGLPLTNYSPATAVGNQGASEISVAESGNAFAITGTFAGTFAFGATPAITATGSPANMFTAMYTLSSSWIWSRDEGDMGAGTTGIDLGFKEQTVVVTGSYTNGAQFNGVAQTSAGSWDIYWTRYNALTGATINTVNTAGGTAGDFGMAVLNLNGALPEADVFGNCALGCGTFGSATVAFGTNNLANIGTSNLFITKLNSQSSVFSQRLGAPADEEPAADATDAAGGLNVLAMPNPFGATTVVRIDGVVPGNSVLKLYDVSGRLIQEPILVTGNAVTLDGSMLENGIYIYTLEAGETSLYTGKLMIQH